MIVQGVMDGTPRQGRKPVCEDEQRLQRTGCDNSTRCFWYTMFGSYSEGGVSQTISARGYKGAEGIMVEPRRKYVVRRLTPLECCRLQGFPDWWEDGVQGSDSARYKMWGNGMALPNMLHVMKGIARLAAEEHDGT